MRGKDLIRYRGTDEESERTKYSKVASALTMLHQSSLLRAQEGSPWPPQMGRASDASRGETWVPGLRSCWRPRWIAQSAGDSLLEGSTSPPLREAFYICLPTMEKRGCTKHRLLPGSFHYPLCRWQIRKDFEILLGARPEWLWWWWWWWWEMKSWCMPADGRWHEWRECKSRDDVNRFDRWSIIKQARREGRLAGKLSRYFTMIGITSTDLTSVRRSQTEIWFFISRLEWTFLSSALTWLLWPTYDHHQPETRRVLEDSLHSIRFTGSSPTEQATLSNNAHPVDGMAETVK